MDNKSLSLIGFEFVCELKQGHTGAEVILVENKFGIRKVIKIGTSERGKTEISNNLIGYKALSELGGAKWLPDYISGFLNEHPFILMDWLGNENWTIRDKRAPISEFEINCFFESWLELIKITRSNSIREVFTTDAVRKIKDIFSNHIIPAQIVNSDALNLIDDVSRIVWKLNSAATPLDFTPDNVFLRSDKFIFIDPWLQSSYQNHPAISMGQFVTLANCVYELPSGVYLRKLQTFMISKIAEIIGTSVELTEVGWLVGATLQLTLSSYVRIKKDPIKATLFANMAIESLSSI